MLPQEISVCSQGSTQNGTSAANEAQGCLAAGFRMGCFFFIISFDDNATKRNIKQKHLCEKQGKDSAGTWLGDGLDPSVLQAFSPLQPLQQRFPGAVSQLK